MNQLIANTGAITGLQGIVDGVSGDMSSFKNSFTGPSDLTSSHGAIGFPMQNAFNGAQSSRDGALGATQVAAGRMAELLGKASQAYASGDTDAAERLKAQADALDGGSSPASASASAGAGAEAASSGAGGAGQMLSQLGQMGGQMAQSITQPLQGLTQAMTQVPQQVMQGVQGIVESATQAAGGGGDAAALAADTGGGDGGPADPDDAKHDDRDADNRRERPGEAGADADRRDEQLGDRAEAGIAPEHRPGAGPAPTRIGSINSRL